MYIWKHILVGMTQIENKPSKKKDRCKKKKRAKNMARLNQTQKNGALVLVVLGLLFAFVALIHMMLALIAYKRKGKFFFTFALAILFLVLASLFFQE
jgi:uncharacterized membrane protein